jgi:hypothetical protein
MGTWGEKAFQNDSALDWAAELAAKGPSQLAETLANVADIDATELLDVDDGSAAIAAAEVVAAALGFGRDRITKALNTWLDANPAVVGPSDLALAKRAVERVLGEQSELRELWDEHGPDNPWQLDVRALLARLGTDAAAAALPRSSDHAPGRRAPNLERDKQVLLAFLVGRGLQPSAEQIARIQWSRDPEQMRRWLARAIDTPSVAALLDE